MPIVIIGINLDETETAFSEINIEENTIGQHNSLLTMSCADTYCCCSGKTIKSTFSQAALRVIESGGCVAYRIHIQTLLQFHVDVHDAISPFDSNIAEKGKEDHWREVRDQEERKYL